MPRIRFPTCLLAHMESLEAEFAGLPEFARRLGRPECDAVIAAVLEETAHRLGDNYPVLPSSLRRPDAQAAASRWRGPPMRWP